MVKGEDSQLSGCGLKPWRLKLDGVREASYYILKEIEVEKWGTHTKNLFELVAFLNHTDSKFLKVF